MDEKTLRLTEIAAMLAGDMLKSMASFNLNEFQHREQIAMFATDIVKRIYDKLDQ